MVVFTGYGCRGYVLLGPLYQVWSATKDKEYRQRLVFNTRLQLIKNSTIIVCINGYNNVHNVPI